jgi:hypothetical protein
MTEKGRYSDDKLCVIARSAATRRSQFPKEGLQRLGRFTNRLYVFQNYIAVNS